MGKRGRVCADHCHGPQQEVAHPQAWARAAAKLVAKAGIHEIRFSTDCSGMEAPAEAIGRICQETTSLRHKLTATHLAACDIGSLQRSFILQNHSPGLLFTDMTDRDWDNGGNSSWGNWRWNTERNCSDG